MSARSHHASEMPVDAPLQALPHTVSTGADGRQSVERVMLENMKSKFLFDAAASAALIALWIVVWPPDFVVAIPLAVLSTLIVASVGVHITRLRRYRQAWNLSPDEAAQLSSTQLAEWRSRILLEREQRLEIRELRLARRTRMLEVGNEHYLDVLDAEPSAETLGELVETDRKLLALIESESQLAFDRILENRYATDDGVDTGLIFADLRDFIERVARLYRPETEHPLLETEIEQVSKSLSSTALHLLIVVEGLPLDLKSYNVGRMYRLIRRSVSYYGTYRKFRPYVEHGFSVLQVARIALGTNPAAAGALWAAGKLAGAGARAVGERLLQRQALELVTDFIRVIGFEAAMVYDGAFRYRDANWVLGTALVNLEISRGDDLAGRDQALIRLCNLALRHEFDRVRLLHQLAKHKPIDAVPAIAMTLRERQDIAAVLGAHCRDTGVDLGDRNVARWKNAIESRLELRIDLQ